VNGGGHVVAQPASRVPRSLGKRDPERDARVEIWRFFRQLPR
ncbi:alpha/beta hydrolase family esterase, partial [Pseudomonas aeruginosa]